MEGAPKVEREEKKGYDREAVTTEAFETALALLEAKVPEGVKTEAAERLVALSEIMTELEARTDNDDRHTMEALAKLRRFTELEIDFKTQREKLELMTH
jgi:hypothetical protein